MTIMKSMKKRINSIINVLRWDNKLKFTITGAGEFTFDPDKVSAENRARAMIHGFEQRIRDAGALSVDRDTGKSASPQEKFEAMKRIADHLMSGATEWNLKTAAPSGVDAGLTILAMVRALGKTVEECEALLAATMTKRGIDRTAALKLWAASKQVAQAILDIKRERLESQNDSDDLLAEMMGDDGEEKIDDDSDDEAPF